MKEDQRYKKIYHVVFSTYKRSTLFLCPEYLAEVDFLLKRIYKQKQIKVFIYEILDDHVHILLEKPRGVNLSWLVKLIKGNSTYYFFKKFPDVKIDLGRGRLWARGYWWETVKRKSQFEKTYLYIKNNKIKHRRPG